MDAVPAVCLTLSPGMPAVLLEAAIQALQRRGLSAEILPDVSGFHSLTWRPAALFYIGSDETPIPELSQIVQSTGAGIPVFMFCPVEHLAPDWLLTPNGPLDDSIGAGVSKVEFVLADLATFRVQAAAAAQSAAFFSLHAAPPRELGPEPLHFTGHAADVDWLEGELRRAKRHARISLVGTGGCGKSAIVREAVARLSPDSAPFAVFPGGIYFHDFYAAPSLDAFFLTILNSACHANLAEAHQAGDAVSNLLSNERCLVCAEGVEKLREAGQGASVEELCRICGPAVVLLTTRDTRDTWNTTARYIDGLSTAEAEILLQRYLADSNAAALSAELLPELAGLTGCHPLALSQAARLIRHGTISAAGLVTELDAAGISSVDLPLRPVESLRILFPILARSLSPAAREAWFVLCLHGASLLDCDTVSSCLGVSHAAARLALDELVERGIAMSEEITATLSGIPDAGWKFSHARFCEWGRTRLSDCDTPCDMILSRWKDHWLDCCRCWIEADFAPLNSAPLLLEYLNAFLANYTKLFPREDEAALEVLTSVGQALVLAGQPAAQACLEQACRLSTLLHGEDARTTLSCTLHSCCAVALTDADRAITLLRNLIPRVQQFLGKGDIIAIQARRQLGSLLASSNSPRDQLAAGMELAEALELCVTNSDNATTLDCLQSYAEFLVNSGDVEEAAPLADRIRETLLQDPASTHFSMLHFCGDIYLRSSQFSKAAEVFRTILAAVPPSINRPLESLLILRDNLAEALSKLGQHEEAIALGTQNQSVCASHYPVQHPLRHHFECRLSDLIGPAEKTG